MPRYFLNLRYRTGPEGLAVDEEGDELPDPEALREYAVETARDLMSKVRIDAIRDWTSCTFEVTDEAGQRVLTLPFAEVTA